MSGCIQRMLGFSREFKFKEYSTLAKSGCTQRILTLAKSGWIQIILKGLAKSGYIPKQYQGVSQELLLVQTKLKELAKTSYVPKKYLCCNLQLSSLVELNFLIENWI